MNAPHVTLEDVCFSYNSSTILDDVTFSINRSENHILLGKSGSGKSTILRLINGMLSPGDGTVTFYNDAGKEIVRPDRRKIGYIMQDDALFPHMTVEDNVAIVPKLNGWSREAIKDRVKTLLDRLELDYALGNRFPHQLSGGQRQRVNIARGIAGSPDLLLMDEPFVALDAMTKASVMADFQHLSELKDTTIIFVTHDISEALMLGNTISILENGKILISGSKKHVVFSQQAKSYLANNQFISRLMAVDAFQGREEHKSVYDLLQHYYMTGDYSQLLKQVEKFLQSTPHE